ncbi:MAG TPA: hypothetical protein VNA24_15910 [Hyalangium sp.]|nr:hypothetical protein [Hyalangium sp.]
MNSGRFVLIIAALATSAIALSAACGNEGGSPCTDCPPMEGRYVVAFAAVTNPDECAPLGVFLPRGPLDIGRAGSALTAHWDGMEMQGTLYQSLDFNLLGTDAQLDGGRTTFSVNGRYAPGSTDGGMGMISGTFTGTYTRGTPQGPQDCALFRPITAAQQGQP